MNNEKKIRKLVSIVIGIVIILFILLKGDFLNNFSNITDSVSSVNQTEKINLQVDYVFATHPHEDHIGGYV